ncbi:MFS transporter [Pseudomonas graminis]|uniref:Predicted arabinose efflux permease, MFS family n=1 Tax=Pseudomonas graminis TaxID=158627 RepID=A0A1H9Y8P8_9PSED|nr:MFS transporter [Pseudomonas graminis]SES64761.1 Predicted arabinose efflux permease, MFS family [Pseudomonas graminis]
MSDSLQNPQVDGRGRSHLGFLAFVLLCFFAASSAPTPLYHLYQQAWGFSSALLTVIFAVYALSLLATLLVFGSLSDYLGRRPVIFIGLLLEIVSMLLFIAATDVSWLIIARVLQGVATGIATSALGAAMLDSDAQQGPLLNSITPMFGMALGALGTSALVEYAPLPMGLAYGLLLAAFVGQAMYLLRIAETVTPQPGVLKTLRPRLGVPAQARGTLLLVLPADIAAWALGGFFLSLAPSLLTAATGSTSVLNGGFAVAALTLSGAISIHNLRLRAPRLALLVGCSFLAVGVSVILAAVNLGWLWLFFTGAVVAGIGFGASFLGALRLLLPLAHAHERGALMAAFLALSYLAFCIPALLAGVSIKTAGLVTTTNVYGGVVVLLAVSALAGLLIQQAGRARAG